MAGSAAVVAWLGWQWALREETHRTPTDPAALQAFAEAFRGELGRLESVYAEEASALEALLQSGASPTAVQQAATGLTGMCQVSLLPTGERSAPVHVEASGRLSPNWPRPEWAGTGAASTGANSLRLPRSDVLRPSRSGGAAGRAGWWRAQDDRWLLHWQVFEGNLVAVALVDRRAVVDVLRAHLQQWSAGRMGALDATRARLAVTDPAGQSIVTRRTGSGAADFLQPFATELGTWQLAAWDAVETAVWRDPVRVVGAWTLAAALGAAGVFTFLQQRKTLRRAEERVSFVNRVSHELRTPVTNMLLNLDLARDHLGPALNGAGTRLDVVADEARRLGRLVDNVLTFSRRDRPSSPPKLAPCVPDDVVDAVLRQFEQSLTRRGVQMEHQRGADTRVMTEADALAQMLANLVSNVEKYAAAGGWLRVTTATADGALTVRVEDRGPGIPAGEAARIFLPFERLSDRPSEGATGTGLGLCIARDLATRLGGRLVLVPATRGACFELWLPVEPVTPEAAAS